MFWYGFVIGMFAGVFFGGATMAMMAVSGAESRREEGDIDRNIWDPGP